MAEAHDPELAVARRCKLIVLGLEVGGSFSREAVPFLWQLAKARACESGAVAPGCATCLLAPLGGQAGSGGAARAGLYLLLELALARTDECDSAVVTSRLPAA